MISNNYNQIYLKNLIEQAILKEWNIKYDARIVRARFNGKKYGKLPYVDYVFPCFELGKILEIEPHVISRKLYTELKKIVSFGANFSVDSINGYLNFLLEPDYFNGNLLMENASFSGNHKKDNYLIVIQDQDFIHFQNLIYLLGALYNWLNLTKEVHVVASFKNNNALSIDDDLYLYNLSDNNTKKKVHTHLDTLEQDDLIYDNNTGATYYSDGEFDFPLRSARGRVYSEALIHYATHRISKNSESNRKLIAVTKSKNYQLIQSPKLKSVYGIEVFDLNVALASFRQIFSRSNSVNSEEIERMLHKRSELLSDKNLIKKLVAKPIERQKIIQLIDTKFEIQQYIHDYQINSAIDNLYETYTTVYSLSPKS
jgi:hypothetical protein